MIKELEMRTPARATAVVAALALAVALGACGDDDDDGAATETSAAATGELAVSGAWARTSPALAEAGAAYLVITGGAEDDTLTGASVEASVAAKVELHETVAAGDTDTTMAGGTMAGTTMGAGTTAAGSMSGGMMEMQPVDSIAVPAGGTVELEPGGLHIMLLDLAAPLEVGATFELTLQFEKAGAVTTTVEVRES